MNKPVLRFFLFDVWTRNLRHVKMIFDKMCTKNCPYESLDLSQGTDKEMFCVCRRVYEEGVDPTMVCCDSCDNWFHLVCINGLNFDTDGAFECPFCVECAKPDDSFAIVHNPECSSLVFLKRKKEEDEDWDLQNEEGNKSGSAKGLHTTVSDQAYSARPTINPERIEDMDTDYRPGPFFSSTKVNSDDVSMVSAGLSKISLDEKKSDPPVTQKSHLQADGSSLKQDGTHKSPVNDPFCTFGPYNSPLKEEGNDVKEENEEFDQGSQLESNHKPMTSDDDSTDESVAEGDDESCSEDMEETEAKVGMDCEIEGEEYSAATNAVKHHWMKQFESHYSTKKPWKMEEEDSNDNTSGNESTQNDEEEITDAKEVDRKELIAEMNKKLKSIPDKFQFDIPFTEFSEGCMRQKVQLTTGSKKSPAIVTKLVFVPKSGHNVISQYFKIKNPYCTLRFTKKKILQDIEIDEGKSAAQVTLYANCSNAVCPGSFVFRILRVPESADSITVFYSKLNKNHLIHDGSESSRDLGGNERKKMQEKLLLETPLEIERKLLAAADSDLLRCGNTSAIKSLSVLNVAKAEAILLKHGDLSPDAFTDLVSTYYLQKKIYSSKTLPGFIQSISIMPLQVTLFCHESLQLYHKLSLKQRNFFIVVDATAKLLEGLKKPFDSREPYYYTVFVKCPQQGVTGVPVFEFITSSQTFSSISQSFLFCMETYKVIFNDTRLFYGCRRAEIDFSKPLLASLLHVFQRCNTTYYMRKLWEAAIESDSLLRNKMFCIHICRVHAQRFLKQNFRSLYKERKNSWEILSVLKDYRFAFVNGRSMSSFFRRTWDIMILTKSIFFTEQVRRVVELIKVPTRSMHGSSYGQDEFVAVHPEAGTPFCRRSPWGQFAHFVSTKVEEKNEEINSNDTNIMEHERRPNPYYNEDAANYFLVNIFPYYPILTKLVFSLFDLPVEEDTTNAIECHHNNLKSVFHKNSTRKPPGRFARYQAFYSVGGCKKYLLALDNINNVSSKKTQSNSQKSREKRRGSPEAHVEQFHRPRKSAPSSRSIFRSLKFITGGGIAYLADRRYTFGNTCNIDGILMVLQALWRYSDIGRDFIRSKIQVVPVTSKVISIIEMIIDDDIGNAKMKWWLEVLNQPLKPVNRCIDMLGDERDNGFQPIFDWVRYLRVRKCLKATCPNYRPDDEISPHNSDTDWRNPGHIFTRDAASLISTFSGASISSSLQEGRCRMCGADCYVTFHFVDGYPDVFFFSLLEGNDTTERSLPVTFTVGSQIYNLFAYSLYYRGDKAKSTSHYTTVFYDDGKRIVYNDVATKLSSKQKQKLSNIPVVGVWLIKNI